MKNNIVLRWTLSAVVILLIVMGSYMGYASIAEPTTSEHEGHGKDSESSESEENKEQNEEHDNHGEHSEGNTSTENEIIPAVHYEEELIHIELKDKAGNRSEYKESDKIRLIKP